MASNALTGLGIALGGRTKDYTQVELAQRKQKQLEERAAKDRKAKELEEITKDIAIKPGAFLDFRYPQATQRVGQFLEEYQKTDGYGQKAQLKFNLLQDLEKFKQEKMDFDKYRQGIAKGELIADDDIEVLNTGKDEADIDSQIKYGGIVKTPEGTYRINAYQNINVPKRQQDLADQVKIKWMQGNTMQGADGKPMLVGEPSKEEFKVMLGSDFDNDPNLQKNLARLYRSQLDSQGITDPQERLAKVKELYITSGLPYLSGNQVRGGGATNNYNFQIGNGQNENPSTTPLGNNKIMIVGQNPATGEKFLGTYTRAKTWALGDAFATIPPGVEAYYGDTGEPVSSADMEKATFNDISVGYVLNKDVTLRGPFGAVKFKKGQPVFDEYFDIAKKNNLVEPAIIASTKVGDRTIYSDGSRFLQSKAITTSKEDTPVIEQNIKDIKSYFESFSKDFESQKRRSSSGTSSQPKSVPSQSKSAQPSSQKTQGRFTTTEGAKAKNNLPKIDKNARRD
jgi:hypothetical protein